MKKVRNLDEQHIYEDCWNGKRKCNFAYPKEWFDISNKSQIYIPAACASRDKINIDVANASNNV
jgi:hypothetical protein